MSTQAEVRYASIDRLPGFTGPEVQGMLGALKARLVARYKLVAVPGRPDELKQPPIDVKLRGKPVGTIQGKRVSVGYGCGTIRIRQHAGENGRAWGDILDLQIQSGWHADVYAFLDPYFGFNMDEPPPTPNTMSILRNLKTA